MIRTFGKYLLDEEIARGGMSRVFSARLRGVGGFEKRLVVKQILPELASDPRFVSMFVQEAKTLVQMSHPHIAPVFELGVVDGVYFLAMEHVEGATLSAILRDGKLAPGLAAHLGVEIAGALHYAHTRFDIVHRDVTPRNVIIDADGHSRLLDFGIAAPLSDEDAEIFGTPGYLSPEQLAGRVEPASDVFSLGAVLFEALTGRRAFEARTVDESERALRAEGPAFAGDGVDGALRAIVERALARDPEARFRSAAELGRALRGWLASAHPEGVGPELGLRAERAERGERLSRAPRDEGVVTPRTHEVRTLATSPALDALVGAEPVGAEPMDAAPSDDAPASEGGTVPIERPSREPAAEPEATLDASARAARPTERASGLASLVPYLLGAALVGALAIGLWPSEEPPRPPEPEPAMRAPIPAEPAEDPPREARPTPPIAPVEPTAAPIEPPPALEVAPQPRATVALTVNASPWAEVELDGRPVGRTPQRALSVRAGRHTILLRCPPLGREVRHSFEATPGRPLVLVADLTADPPVVRTR